MSYIVVTEQQASAREYVLEGLNRLKAALDANVGTLKAGDRAVALHAIHLSAQHAIGQFPAIQIEATETEETSLTLSGMGGGSGENLLRMTFRVFAYDVALGEAGRLAQNLLRFSDRIRTTLRYNPTLDGFCRDVAVRRVVYGRLRGGPRTTNPVFAPHPILAAQMDVVVEKEIARP